MIKMKSMIVLVLLLTIILSACSNDTPDNSVVSSVDDNIQPETEESILRPDVPYDTFDGYTFTILNIDPASMHWATHTLTTEQQSGDVLNDSIYSRNASVEEMLDIRITDTQVSSGEIAPMIQRSVSADDDQFDAAMMGLNTQGNMAQYGFLVDWNTIPYIDLDKPWWSQSTNSDISIMNKLFLAAGDIGLAYYDAVMPLIMNLRMVEDFQLGDPYELVLSGKWTADKVRELMVAVTSDLNGDGEFTATDQFGMFGMSEEYTALISAFGERIIKKDADDMPYLAIDTESFQRKFEKITQTMNNDNVFLNYRLDKFGDKSGVSLVGVFQGGRALFNSDVLFHMSTMRDMTDDFAILPRAKYDENQEEHYSYIHQSAVLMCVPASAKNLERTGIILESLAAESKYTVIKTYYDVVLSQKYARDEQSIKMLDIIFANRVVDLGSVFNWGGINENISKYGEMSDNDIASLYASSESMIKAAIEKYIMFE